MTIERLSFATGFPPETLKYFAQTGFLPTLDSERSDRYDGLELLKRLEEAFDCE